jgi:hypothetical protein
MRKFSLFIVLFILWNVSQAQLRGEIVYEQGGISFKIPDGWEGSENYQNSIILSNPINRMSILIAPNYALHLKQMIDEAKNGYKDNGGLNLKIISSLKIDEDSLGLSACFEGTVNFSRSKSFFYGKINQLGYGLSLIAFANTEDYNEEIEKTAIEIINSIKTFVPYENEKVAKWKESLAGSQLCNQNLRITDNLQSSEELLLKTDTVKISICASSFVKVQDNTIENYNNEDANENLKMLQATEGSWSAVGTIGGGVALQLIFYNSSINLFYLEYFDNNILLNGNVFYRTYASDGLGLGPICN